MKNTANSDDEGAKSFMHYYGYKQKDHIVQWVKQKIGRPSTPAKCFDLGEIVVISKFTMVYFGDSEDTDLFKIHEEIAKTE
jgi:hypothetical protein